MSPTASRSAWRHCSINRPAKEQTPAPAEIVPTPVPAYRRWFDRSRGTGDVAAIGETLLPDQRRAHVGHDRDPIVIGEVEGRDQLDPLPLGIQAPHVEEAEIRAAAAARAENPGADSETFDIVIREWGGDRDRRHITKAP